MKAVYGLYRDGQAAQQAVNRLRAAGIADRDITVISAQPMEDYELLLFRENGHGHLFVVVGLPGRSRRNVGRIWTDVADGDRMAHGCRRVADLRVVA